MWRNHNQSKPDLWPRHDFCQCWFILFKGLVQQQQHQHHQHQHQHQQHQHQHQHQHQQQQQQIHERPTERQWTQNQKLPEDPFSNGTERPTERQWGQKCTQKSDRRMRYIQKNGNVKRKRNWCRRDRPSDSGAESALKRVIDACGTCRRTET